MTRTTIEWADEVWNPVTGCTKVSLGCKNCYAERIANRFWGERKFTDVVCHEDRLADPFKWKKPRRVFVNSMSDLFHQDVPDEFIRSVWWTMQLTAYHTFMILTKRPKRMYDWLTENTIGGASVLSNVWIGVSAENQQAADERIPILLQMPASVRFVSVEPMLGPVDLGHFLCKDYIDGKLTLGQYLDWVICGCESGPGARPFDTNWAHILKDQCVEAGVPFFYKQGRGVHGQLVKMPKLYGDIWAQYPEVK